MTDVIMEVRNELKSKIAVIDKRIERRSGATFFDETEKMELLHGEALAYEKVLKMLEKY